MSNRIKVEIYGQSYTMAETWTKVYVQQLARYVDEKMNAVSAATQTVDSCASLSSQPWLSPMNCTRSGWRKATVTKICANAPRSGLTILSAR